ncbi:MAG: hypothetical protein AAFY16_01030 [Cyanobacteria bacterium J06642_3]
MSQQVQRPIPNKTVEKVIKAKIKQELSAQGINTTTKQGNKELKFLANKIATRPFHQQEEVEAIGDKLAQHLSQLFQQKNKQNLDGNLIHQVAIRKDFWSLTGLPIEEVATTENSPRLEEKVSVTSSDDAVAENATEDSTQTMVEADTISATVTTGDTAEDNANADSNETTIVEPNPATTMVASDEDTQVEESTNV